MFNKVVDAVVWDDCRKPGRRESFAAEYVFDEGFSSLDECAGILVDPEKYVYLWFCDQWYAINGRGRKSWLVITKNSCYEVSRGRVLKTLLPVYNFKETFFHDSGRKRWPAGIFLDLVHIDPNLELQGCDGIPAKSLVETSNAAFMFGSLFFSSALRLDYDCLSHVLPHYFEGKELERKWNVADRLMQDHAFSWNPFTGECYRSEEECEVRAIKRLAQEK